MRRRAWLRTAAAAGLVLLAPSLARAEELAAAPRPPRRPSPRRAAAEQPLPLPPPAPPYPPPPRIARGGPGGDPAPIPDRAIEAPRPVQAPPKAELEPALITPQRQQRGQTFGAEHAPNNDDLLFREPAAGARLRIPFSY